MNAGLPARTEVLVIGAGAVGLGVAYYLARAGREVVVVDRGEPGRETSWGNCGLITPSLAEPLTRPGSLRHAARSWLDPEAPLRIAPTLDLNRWRWFLGFARNCNRRHRVHARQARWVLTAASRRMLEQLIVEERLECEWQTRGLTSLFLTRAALEEHQAELEQARELGLTFEVWDREQLLARQAEVTGGVIGAIHTPGDAHLDPGRLGTELARVVAERGVRVVAGVSVERLRVEGGRACGAVTGAGEVHAEQVVLAAGPWSAGLLRPLGLKLPVEPGKGYSITWNAPVQGLHTPFKLEERKVVATPWSAGFRLGSTMEFAGYDSRLNRRRLDYLVRGAREYLRLPELGAGEEWFGWRPMSVDELPILGPSGRLQGLNYACGHGQLGVSQCAATGKLIAELMADRPPHIDPAPFDPGRFGL